jgi:dihydroorotate dehydrogenase
MGALYRRLVRPILFRCDPEWIHDRALRAAQWNIGANLLLHARYDDCLKIAIAGIPFATPIGLAAGFDKSGRAIPFLSRLGFGHVEIGSISADPSAGNPKPRLFRLPRDRAIVVNYGLPNDGADLIAARLSKLPRQSILAINLVSTNRGPGVHSSEDDIISDYLRSATPLHPFADFLVLNLSCPNTESGRSFFSVPARLRTLLSTLRDFPKPLFLKISVATTPPDLDAILSVAHDFPTVRGFSTNLAPGKPARLISRADHLPGSVSGAPASNASDNMVRALYQRIDPKRHSIISSGGVFTGQDAYRKLRLGASLVQILTALIYEGPFAARTISHQLAQLLARDGVTNLCDIIGIDSRK